MSDRGLGNEVQHRQILEQVAEAVLTKWHQEHPQPKPEPPKAEMPAPFKWAAGIIASLMTAGTAALFLGMVTTLNNLQLTVARIDERQQRDTTPQRLDKIEERLTSLERRGQPE